MIHRYRVQNFKSIVDVDVDLSPVTVLVGTSGTGKSNFVQSLRCLRDMLSSPNQVQQNWADVRPAVNTNEPTQFEIDFAVAGIDDRYTYELSVAAEGLQSPVLHERLKLGEKCLFHQVSEAHQSRMIRAQVSPIRWEVAPALIQLPTPGQIALGRIPSISEVVIAFTALTSGIGFYAFSDQVLTGGNANGVPATGLNDGATNYLKIIKEIIVNLQDLKVRKSIVEALRWMNPSVSSVELNDIANPSSVLVGHKFDGKTLNLGLSQESDGFRRFYAQLLALYQQPSKQTLLIEHPEDGIHPAALALLAEEFKAAAATGRGQVILTTHSPRLLDQFDEGEIRVAELDGFATRIGRISIEQQESLRERLLDPGELLTVDPARILEKEAAAR